jgi:hypothetical protein
MLTVQFVQKGQPMVGDDGWSDLRGHRRGRRALVTPMRCGTRGLGHSDCPTRRMTEVAEVPMVSTTYAKQPRE